MSRLRLFRVRARSGDSPMSASVLPLERSLQTLIERNLGSLFDVRFLASEYATGRRHGGRIDTIGLDSHQCPIIVEYKRSTASELLSQGLYYLDWLDDHRDVFRQLVEDHFRRRSMMAIDWSACRLIYVAGGFSRYDVCAVRQIHRQVELVWYQWFGDDLLLLESVIQDHAHGHERGGDV
jgi:hypothetical protein